MTPEWPYRDYRDYLKKLGLNTEASAQLEEYRRLYKQQYHKFYQRQHRKDNPEFTLHFTKSQAKKLKALASEDNISVQQLIKRLTLEVLGNPVQIQSQVTIETKQILSNIYSEIQNMIRNELPENHVDRTLFNQLLSRIERIEELIDSEVWS